MDTVVPCCFSLLYLCLPLNLPFCSSACTIAPPPSASTMSTPKTVKQLVKDISALSSSLSDAVPGGSKDDKIWSVLVRYVSLLARKLT
ncbi:hypothetical protein F5148DRAFT_1243924 [Russula earlei]|uniref:Uncharacterized protein n=1 Tax=Russula earlei TaxID=71964 RepID=A0ACC0TUW4_9AGAM|nr:hypothetical protein F5148DRAFT_1243924 [Russula earlei]